MSFLVKKKLAWMEETIWYLAEREHQINESPIKTSPEEKLDCRRLINHLREMS